MIKKHPELVSTDTVIRIDTIRYDGVQHDTVLQNIVTNDTIILRDKQLEIRYYNDGKTVYLKGKCDTVYKVVETPVIVNKVEVVKAKWYHGLKNILILCIILFVLYILYKIVK